MNDSQGLCMAMGNCLPRYREIFKILIWFKRLSRSWWKCSPACFGAGLSDDDWSSSLELWVGERVWAVAIRL
jgi:hypothetical protein